jgi:beta-galactosidase
VPYHPGKLEVTGINSGQQAAFFTMETSKRPNGIKAVATKKVISASGGVAQIEIQIVDEDGKPVMLADDEITCSTVGPVKLIGLEAANPADMGDYTDHRQRVFQGKMIAYLRATGQKGKAKVTFSSPWLKEQMVDLEIE